MSSLSAQNGIPGILPAETKEATKWVFRKKKSPVEMKSSNAFEISYLRYYHERKTHLKCTVFIAKVGDSLHRRSILGKDQAKE